MTTNFESAFHLCQLAHPLLKASGMGSIINISSIAGIVARDKLAIYAATKGIYARNQENFICIIFSLIFCLWVYFPWGALNQLTRNLACEWAKDNIRTNCVAPGLTRTPMAQHVRALRPAPLYMDYREEIIVENNFTLLSCRSWRMRRLWRH